MYFLLKYMIYLPFNPTNDIILRLFRFKKVQVLFFTAFLTLKYVAAGPLRSGMVMWASTYERFGAGQILETQGDSIRDRPTPRSLEVT